MIFHCRTCQSALQRLELGSGSGDSLLIRTTPAFEAFIGELEDFNGTEPWWLARFLDGYPCFACETVDLAVNDLKLFLASEGEHLPHSDCSCPACDGTCRGPLVIECFGCLGTPLVYLTDKFGAPLTAWLCVACGRVWLSLYPDDAEARQELANRFPESGRCANCKNGRVRVTRVDVPGSGFARLYKPQAAEGGNSQIPVRVRDLLVAACDSCGEVVMRLAPSPEMH